MSPSATADTTSTTENVEANIFTPSEKAVGSLGSTEQRGEQQLGINHRQPLKPSGALDHFESFDVTPVIGREFVNVDVAEWLRAPNSDELIRELAITISRRGVVFFRKQDNITNDLQKELVQRLGQLTGKPESSGLHIHPAFNPGQEHGGSDNEISVISSEQAKKMYSKALQKSQSQRMQWHSDITFEPVPSDYTLLRLTQLPKIPCGPQDTKSMKESRSLYASSYYAQPAFGEAATKNNFTIYPGPRGSPLNVGDTLEANHPVVRTNPITGWKSVFAVGIHAQKINGLTEEESRHFLQWFVQLIVENHDLQVRNRWQNVNDLAIWDNRSVYHAATPDYIGEGLGERTGSRAVSIGEQPYFDPASVSRREGLSQEQV
ncbi:hypothetical protein JX266_012709 [Neoarthrinium moseri]|nr:hypothetical protein JX266_012709 [Neoarthrinium moseri]